MGRIWLALALLLAGCAPGSDLPPLPEAASGPYRLGAGDVVRVTVVGGDQVSGEYQVDDAGNVALPLLGPVHAAGRTSSGLAEAVAAALKTRALYRDPSVVAEVRTYRPVYILGEVTKPGAYPYVPGMTVLTAVSIAGGFTDRAVKETASIVRDGAEGRVTRSSAVEPGDVINIFERHF